MYTNKRVVCIGGGTGLSTMLRGLKNYTEEITAIVTVADNGGSSGILRREMNMLPPGDIRNCILALAETEPVLAEVFQYRFTSGSLEGQNLGNLFLAAMTEIYGSFEKAVETANDVFAVTGQVLPVTTENIQLRAYYEDGTTITGEHEIVYTNKVVRKKIDTVELLPKTPNAYYKAIQAIAKADTIILGPGSLFTSIIPNLLVNGISKSIRDSFAKVVYVANIMTQPGETDNFTLKMHVDEIERYLGQGVIDYVIANNSSLDSQTIQHYKEDDAILVENDYRDKTDFEIIETDFATVSGDLGYVRHNAGHLADIIIKL